jgi:hypothetical protein
VCKRVSEKPDCACARFVLAGGSSGAAPVCAVTGFVNAVTQLANAVTQQASSMTASASSVAQLESPVIPSPNAMTARAALWLSSRVERLRSRVESQRW